MRRRTEELVEVGVEVAHLARGDVEGEDLPVGVGPAPEVPGVPGNIEADEDLRADGLDTTERMGKTSLWGGGELTLRDQRARSCCRAFVSMLANCAGGSHVHLVRRSRRRGTARLGFAEPNIVALDQI